jgi:hypothetical protein
MMPARILPVLALGLFALGVTAQEAQEAQEVYRWVDESGTVHFSDRPLEGDEDAKPIVLPRAQTFESQAIAAPAAKSDSDKKDSSGYDNLTILRPGALETLWATAGELEVEVALSPGLRRGHSVLLFLDEQMVNGEAVGDLTYKLTDVYRGTHALRAEVRDGRGKSVIQSSPTEFTVHQTSILNPNNPANIPRPGG